jgi:hypothetical protein
MKNNPTTILAINPVTRYLGIAVLRGSDLVDWGIKCANGGWSDEKLEKIMDSIAKLVAEHDPDILAIKSIHPSRSSRNLDLIGRRLTELAESEGIRAYTYTIEELRAFFEKSEKTVADLVCLQYPVLLREFRKEQNCSNAYHSKMFEAVALGMLVATQAVDKEVLYTGYCRSEGHMKEQVHLLWYNVQERRTTNG